MSLFQATNVTPSTLAPIGHSTVAQTDNVNIQWQINGTTSISYIQVDVLQNDATSTLVHSTGITPKSASGTDAKGNPIPAVYAPSNTTWASWDLADGNTYKLRLLQFGGSVITRRAENDNSIGIFEDDNYCVYNEVNRKYYIFTSPITSASSDPLTIDIFDNYLIFNYDDAVANYGRLYYASAILSDTPNATTVINNATTEVTVPACIIPNVSNVFYVMPKPTISFSPGIPSTITSISYPFLAICSSVGLNWSRWVLKKADGTVVDDTGMIATTSDTYSYDGFVNDTDYVLTRTVEDIYNVQATASISFHVEYVDELQVPIPVSVCIDPSDASANIEWSAESNITGTLNTGSATYIGSRIVLSENQNVTWDSVDGEAMSITSPYQIAWHGITPQVSSGSTLTLLTLNGTNTNLYVDHSKLWVVTPGTGANITYIPLFSDTSYMTILLRDVGIAVWYYDYQGRRVYAYDTIQYFETGIPSTITSIKLSGAQTCDWLCVTQNTTLNFQYPSPSGKLKPSWDGDMMFYADFNGDLQAGFSLADTAKCYIYREDVANGTMRFIGSVNSPSGAIKDYGAKSLAQIKYYVICFNDQNVMIGYASTSTVCKQLTALYLYEAVADETQDNVYHVVKTWRFGNNFSSGSVSNNNSPSFLKNFTKYQRRQSVSLAGKSGTLSALLSNFHDLNEYEDTAAQMDELYNLSLTQNHVFLKDTKGNFYEVHTSAPITQTVNTMTRIQEVTVNVPWQEVADASYANLIS